jgi:hypothetical protein
MAVSSSAFVQQPSGNKYLPTLTGAPRIAGIDDTPETARPVIPTDAASDATLVAPDLASTVIPFSPEYRRRQNASSSNGVYRSAAGPGDPPRQIYNPRGAPSDAVPAMSRLEARIAFEPVFMQHYASTLYALVSKMPTTLAERRQAFDLLA